MTITTPSRLNAADGLVRSTAAGAVAALVGAIIWAFFVQITNTEIGIVAVLIGFLVGQAMAATAGTSDRLPAIGAVLSLLGCLLGQLISDAHYFGRAAGLSTGGALSKMITHPSLASDVFKAGFEAIDLVFWAIAAYEGYKLTARAVARRKVPARSVPAGPSASYLPHPEAATEPKATTDPEKATDPTRP